jgi:hypothetical protein
VKTRSTRRRGVVRLSTIILDDVDAIRRHRCSRCVASSIPPLAPASFFCVRRREGCRTARARCERLLGLAARHRLGALRALERRGAPQVGHSAGLRAAWWRRLGKVERVRALGIYMPRSSLGLGHWRRTTEMAPRLGEATWRASNRASASARDQGEALGARVAAGVWASWGARSSPSHRCAHAPRMPVRPEVQGRGTTQDDRRALRVRERRERRRLVVWARSVGRLAGPCAGLLRGRSGFGPV